MTKNISHDVRAVANHLLKKSRIKNKGVDCLSIMKLLKLISLSHGWSLAYYENDIPLVEQLPEAWQYGPVYTDVYNKLSNFGKSPIDTLIINEETRTPYDADFSDYQKKIMDAVLLKYDGLEAYTLSRITHFRGSPWNLTVKLKGFYAKISHESMQKYYRTLVECDGISLV